MTHFERPTAMTFATQASSGAFYNKLLTAIEGALDDIQDQVTDLAQIVLDIQAAQAAADAADAKARNRMDDLPEITILGDYTGAIDSSQFPILVSVARYDGATNVSSSSTWTRTVESGDVTCTIGAATGILEATDCSTDSVVLIESARNGLTLRKRQSFKIKLSDPPNTGSGSSSWTDTTFSSINAATMAAISDELTVLVGSSGTVTLSAPLSFMPVGSAPVDSYKVWGIWQWWDGAAWQDLGAEVASSPNANVSHDSFSGARLVTQGRVSVPSSKSGLAPAASEKFRLLARNDTGTAVISFAGTASATS